MNAQKLLFLPVLLAFLSFGTGCANRQPQYLIGVSQCTNDAWREKMNYEMERELLLHPEMKLSRRSADGSNERQCAQIDSFIAERVDLLIVSPNEAEQVKPAVTRAFKAGIPVIVADRRVTGDEWTAFIGGDNYKVGTLMAEWVIEKLQTSKQSPSGSNPHTSKPFVILEVAGLPGSTPATLRHKGLVDGLANYQLSLASDCADGQRPRHTNRQNAPAGIELAMVMGSWYKENAYEVVSDYLKGHSMPDVVVAHNDLMAIGAAEALKSYHLSIPIMGVDGIRPGLKAIVDGTIECSATYASRGDLLIDVASRILHGEPYVRDTVLTTTMVDQAAAYPMLLQDEAITRDLETLHIVQTQTENQWKQIRFGRLILISFGISIFLLLVAVIVYILTAQRKMQAEIKSDILPQLEEVQVAIQLSHRDIAFSERLKQTVQDHLSDPNLNVESLGSMLQLSRTQLFRRVKAVTGKGPLDYIREQRLIKADELLRTTDMTIQQVALEYGFSNPGYFTKCYKDYFGHLPSER